MPIQPKEIQVVDNQNDKLEVNSDGSININITDPTTGLPTRVESDGCLAVCIQDQHTETIDTYFAQNIGSFNVSSDAQVSDVTSLYYDVYVDSGHGLTPGSEILIGEIDRSMFSQVTSSFNDYITLDRPIDYQFTVDSSFGIELNTNMAVDGSSTPQIFSIRAGETDVDIVRFIIKILSASNMDDGRFGSLPALGRGLVLRVYNGFQKNIFNFKSNGEIKNFCYDGSYADKAPAGLYGFSSRITFGGQSKHGVTIRIGKGDVLQWIVQDDLTGLDTLQITAEGHKTTF